MAATEGTWSDSEKVHGISIDSGYLPILSSRSGRLTPRLSISRTRSRLGEIAKACPDAYFDEVTRQGQKVMLNGSTGRLSIPGVLFAWLLLMWVGVGLD